MIEIDRMICLSLKKRQDRRDLLLPQVIKAQDMGILPKIELEFYYGTPWQQQLIPASWRSSSGYYAATESHKRVLEKLWEEGARSALILEDDARFLPSFYTDADRFFNQVKRNRPDWLGMFLGGGGPEEKQHVSDGICINKGSVQCHAYILNRHGIWRTFDHLWVQKDRIVDWSYLDMMRSEDCFYRPEEWMIGTQAGYSDNLFRSVGEE